VNFGIETLLICVEMVPFAIFFHWAYDVRAYGLSRSRPLAISEMGMVAGKQSPTPGTSSEEEAPEGGADHYHYVTEYQRVEQEQQQQRYAQTDGYYQHGPLGVKAWANLPNLKDILMAVIFSFSMRSEAKKMDRQVVGAEQQQAQDQAYGLPAPYGQRFNESFNAQQSYEYQGRRYGRAGRSGRRERRSRR
jgi:hypothetical protein